MNVRARVINSAAIFASAMTGSMAFAQGASPSADAGMDEIIVTAQKRAESAQNVPIAITALTGKALDRTGISNLEGLQSSVPSLTIGQTSGAARIALRGVGLDHLGVAAEGSIGLHVNGVFIARGAAALAAFYDVERVEVLRGPQGTLYGRNTTAGAINVITRRPTEDAEGYLNLTYGNYNALKVEGAVSGPIMTDVVLARFAYSIDRRDGWGRNLITGTEIDNANRQSARGMLEFRPGDDVKLLLSADYHREKDHNYAYHYFGTAAVNAAGNPTTPTGVILGGSVSAPGSKDVAHDTDPNNRRTFWGVSGDLTWDLGFAEFHSQTAYRYHKYFTNTDLDQTSTRVLSPWIQTETAKQFSQELQLTGTGDRLKWLAGLFYFRESDSAISAAPANDFMFGRPAPGTLRQGLDNRGVLVTKAAAAYGQIDYKITPELQISLGARYSWEKKHNDSQNMTDLVRLYDPANPFIATPGLFQNESKSFSAFTPRVSVDYHINPDVLLYASWSKGFKSGTYKVGVPRPVVYPEKITAYEAGLKSTLANGLLRLNLTGFYYDYKDLQVSKLTGLVLALENAANARIYGLELEARLRPVRNLEFNFNGSYLNAKFVDFVSTDPSRPNGDGVTVINGFPSFNLAGNRLSQAPEFTAAGGAEYRIEMQDYMLTLRGEVAWTDSVFFTAFNRPEVGSGPKTKVNAFATFEPSDGPWSFTLFAKNIGGKRYTQNSYINAGILGYTITGGLEEPRTYGATARFNF